MQRELQAEGFKSSSSIESDSPHPSVSTALPSSPQSVTVLPSPPPPFPPSVPPSAAQQDPADITVAYNLSVLIDIESRGTEFRRHGPSDGAFDLAQRLSEAEGKLSAKVIKYYDALLYSIGGSLDTGAANAAREEGRDMDVKRERIELLEGIISRVEMELFQKVPGGMNAISIQKREAAKEFAQSNLQNLQKMAFLRDSYFDLAVIRHRQAKLSAAVECYTKALKIDPGFREARACLGAVL